MISFNRLIAAIAATATLQLGLMRLVSAQNDTSAWCYDSRFDNPNATASYTVPGFNPPEDRSDSTWTYSVGVVTYNGNTTQRLWINTSPAIQVDSDSLPYQGCILGFTSLAKEPGDEGQDNNGDCKSTLGEECVTALLKSSNEIAKNLSARADEDLQRYKKINKSNFSFESAQCSDFVSNLPSECGNATIDYFSVSSIGHHPSSYINETLARENGFSDATPCPDLGKGSAATSPFWEFYPISPSDLPEDFKDFRSDYNTYDQWLGRNLPVLVPVWSKDSKNPWSDTRLICTRPEEIKQEDSSSTTTTGSPAPSAQSTGTSGGVRIGGYGNGKTIITFGLISVITAVLLF